MIPKKIAQELRRMAKAGNSVKIMIADGDSSEPELRGSKSYYTTKSGNIITHPNAYKWPKVYHPSTIHVHVGEKWLGDRRRGWLKKIADELKKQLIGLDKNTLKFSTSKMYTVMFPAQTCTIQDAMKNCEWWLKKYPLEPAFKELHDLATECVARAVLVEASKCGGIRL